MSIMQHVSGRVECPDTSTKAWWLGGEVEKVKGSAWREEHVSGKKRDEYIYATKTLYLYED